MSNERISSLYNSHTHRATYIALLGRVSVTRHLLVERARFEFRACRYILDVCLTCLPTNWGPPLFWYTHQMDQYIRLAEGSLDGYVEMAMMSHVAR